jgi:pSer/pThr/pTyr-binding forkhead associated (FHA) protein
MSDDTIFSAGPIGRRLECMLKDDERILVFRGRRIPLVGKLVVGRDQSCDIVLDNKLVSKKHALIQKIKDEFFIADMNSTNGTYVNEELVPEGKYVKLEAGDKIKIGKTVLTLK